MSKRNHGWRAFASWVNGDREERPTDLFTLKNRPQRVWRRALPDQRQQKKEMRSFLDVYPVVCVLLSLFLVGVLLCTVIAMPPFGKASNPTNNEVPRRYIERVEEETGAKNAVSGMILNYRGFDTFGESCVLYLAVTSVFMLLLRDKNNFSKKDLEQYRREERWAQREPDVVLQKAAAVLTPFTFLFAACMLLGGHLSPGGGFAGGAILGGGLILYNNAFGTEKLGRFFNRRVYDAVRLSGLLLYAVLFAYYIFCGANGLDNHIPLTVGGLILPIDVAVGLVVACTMYGFYAMFTKEEL